MRCPIAAFILLSEMRFQLRARTPQALSSALIINRQKG
jgi:hypothetical protein